MKFIQSFLKTAILSLVFVVSCSSPSSNNQSDETQPVGVESSVDFSGIAGQIIRQCDLQKGEKVILVSKPGRFDPMVDILKGLIEERGAEYLGTLSTTEIQPESWDTDFTKGSNGLNDEELQDYLKEVELGIMLPMTDGTDKVYDLILNNLKDGIGRTIHFHWSGAYDLNGNPIEISDEIDGFYQNVVLSTDYTQLALDQKRLEEAMRANAIQVTTPTGTDITFEIGDRPVTKQDGDASAVRMQLARNVIDREIEIPSGAVRVAPIETTVNGKIAFPDALWADSLVIGLVLTFEAGKVVDMQAESGLEYVQNVMEEAGESASSFREFALGMNPTLAIPEENPWIPYYGYGSGVVRLSLGDNTELGGDVTGGFVRWNFFTNATVKIGEEIWVENGNLIK